MQQLEFRQYHFQTKNTENKWRIFDIIRKKYVVLTPEEWVRQHVIHFLVYDKGYPKTLMAVERLIKVNDLEKRFDIAVFNTDGSIHILVECKSYKVKITQGVFDQIARYNLTLKSSILMLTNGLTHYYCSVNNDKQQYDFLDQLPIYTKVVK